MKPLSRIVALTLIGSLFGLSGCVWPDGGYHDRGSGHDQRRGDDNGRQEHRGRGCDDQHRNDCQDQHHQ